MLVIPLMFYIAVVLKFILIPLMFALFLALLFTPMMRWMRKRNMHQIVSFAIVLVVLFGSLFLTFKVIQLSGKEINAGLPELLSKLDHKLVTLADPLSEIFAFEENVEQSTLKKIIKSKKVSEVIYENAGLTFSFVQHTLTTLLMTLFFLILLLAGSWNLKMLTYNTLSQGKTRSFKTFIAVERSISQFLKVKFFVSLLTGLGFGLAAYFFGLSFPLFWGLFTFAINFVQMVGSFISTILLTLFAYIELESPGTLLAVALVLTGIQVLFGSIIEPIMMGRSFSINIITVLIVLMFWGFLWGIPGLILAIPVTVLLKTILSQFDSTQKIVKLMS